jgi:hypothetical protein
VHALIVTRAESRLDELVRAEPPPLVATTSVRTALASPVWADRISAPVVDAAGTFVGAAHRSALRRFVEAHPAEAAAGASTLAGLGDLYVSAWGRLMNELAAAVAGPRAPGRRPT